MFGAKRGVEARDQGFAADVRHRASPFSPLQ
jgi:hypothetical protein